MAYCGSDFEWQPFFAGLGTLAILTMHVRTSAVISNVVVLLKAQERQNQEVPQFKSQHYHELL